MTRINVAIPPKHLSDQHLIAEHREIKRLPKMFEARVAKNHPFNDIPALFTLNHGHMTFFMDKGLYSLKRYKEIYNECLARGKKVTDYSQNWNIYTGYQAFFNDYSPNSRDKKLLQDRIASRLKTAKTKTHTYYSKPVTVEYLINLIT